MSELHSGVPSDARGKHETIRKAIRESIISSETFAIAMLCFQPIDKNLSIPDDQRLGYITGYFSQILRCGHIQLDDAQWGSLFDQLGLLHTHVESQ